MADLCLLYVQHLSRGMRSRHCTEWVHVYGGFAVLLLRSIQCSYRIYEEGEILGRLLAFNMWIVMVNSSFNSCLRKQESNIFLLLEMSV